METHAAAITNVIKVRDLGSSYKLFFLMSRGSNLFIFHTNLPSGIVNACIRCGDLDSAMRYFNDSQKNWGIVPNEVVITTLMKGLCGEGRQREATSLLFSMKKTYNADPNDRMAATLIRGCMRNTDGKSALVTIAKLKEIHINVARNGAALEYAVKALSSDGMLKEAAAYLAEYNEKVNHAACVALATACIIAGDEELAKAAISSAKSQLDGVQSKQKAEFMHRTPATKKPNIASARENSAAMFNRLRDKEVTADIDKLEGVLLGVTTIATSKTVTCYKEDPKVLILPQKKIDLSAHFADLTLPLRVEVCSGHGEWVVDRASSERGKANWIGVEIRPDRVYQAWTKRKLLGSDVEPSDNLLLICGDAREAVDLLRGANIHDFFINYPEPPGWMGAKSNLLDPTFFEGIHGALAVGGAVTMVSDHALYSAHTSLNLVKLSKQGLYYSSLQPGTGVPISTDIPANYGSSYFDRMWLNGKRRKRFFIHFIKPNQQIATLLQGLVGGDDEVLAAKMDSDDDVSDGDDDFDYYAPGPTRRRVALIG